MKKEKGKQQRQAKGNDEQAHTQRKDERREQF